MKAYTSPVLSSTEHEGEIPVIDLAGEVKASSFDAVLQQIDQWGENKFIEPVIRLRGKLTPEELSKLNEKIISVSTNWQAELTFEEYKAYKERFKGTTWYQPPSMHEFEHDYNKLKSAGLKWEFVAEFETEDTETIDFITQQLSAGRVKKISLAQLFSEKPLNSILRACQNTALEHIHFSAEQQLITDRQATLFLECFQRYNLQALTELPGNELSEATAEKLAFFAARKDTLISVTQCPFFDKRKRIEFTIQRIQSPMNCYFLHTYSSADIKRLNEALKTEYGHAAYHEKKCSTPELKLSINTKELLGNTDDWVTFFTTLFDSDVNITELWIEEPIIELKIMIAIMAGLGTNRTIKKLYVSMALQMLGRITANATLAASLKLNSTLTSIKIIAKYLPGPNVITDALETHPALTSLKLKSCSMRDFNTGTNLKKLLTNTKTLRHLAVTYTGHAENIISELADGLKENSTLDSLTLSELTNQGMCMLARAFSHNQSLTKFTFDSSFVNCKIEAIREPTPEGMYKFIRLLKHSHYLKQVHCALPEVKNAENAEHQQLLRQITLENTEKWIRKKRQPYVDAMIVLFRTHVFDKHIVFSVPAYFNAILSFLKPSADAATPEQIDRCTRLVRKNMRLTQWETSITLQRQNSIEVFEKWNKRLNDEVVYAEKSGNPSPLDTKTVPENIPHDNLENSPLDPNNTMAVEDFHRVLDTYESRSLLPWCCFWNINPHRSTTMRELWKIQPEKGRKITRAQVEQAISLDSEQRKDYFNSNPGADKGNKGTDNVISQLKRHFNY